MAPTPPLCTTNLGLQQIPWPQSWSRGREASLGGDRAQGASCYLLTFMAGGMGWGRPSPPGQQPALSPAFHSLLPTRVPSSPVILPLPEPPQPTALSRWLHPLTCMAAAPHAHLGIIDSERPAPGHAHVGGGLHFRHVRCAGARDAEVALPITRIEAGLGVGWGMESWGAGMGWSAGLPKFPETYPLRWPWSRRSCGRWPCSPGVLWVWEYPTTLHVVTVLSSSLPAGPQILATDTVRP